MSNNEAEPKKRQGERNPGASVQQKLRNYAKATGDDVALVLARYVNERFLCLPALEWIGLSEQIVREEPVHGGRDRSLPVGAISRPGQSQRVKDNQTDNQCDRKGRRHNRLPISRNEFSQPVR